MHSHSTRGEERDREKFEREMYYLSVSPQTMVRHVDEGLVTKHVIKTLLKLANDSEMYIIILLLLLLLLLFLSSPSMHFLFPCFFFYLLQGSQN